MSTLLYTHIILNVRTLHTAYSIITYSMVSCEIHVISLIIIVILNNVGPSTIKLNTCRQVACWVSNRVTGDKDQVYTSIAAYVLYVHPLQQRY